MYMTSGPILSVRARNYLNYKLFIFHIHTHAGLKIDRVIVWSVNFQDFKFGGLIWLLPINLIFILNFFLFIVVFWCPGSDGPVGPNATLLTVQVG
jgi:hypothetical protein